MKNSECRNTCFDEGTSLAPSNTLKICPLQIMQNILGTFAGWARHEGLRWHGIEVADIPGHGLGVRATRSIKVTTLALGSYLYLGNIQSNRVLGWN